MINMFKVALMSILFFISISQVKVYATEKVLLDSDVVELFDDGVAMIMLAKSDDIQLLGVTTSTGNNWVENSTAFAIRQLEGLKIKNIPVVQGSTPKRIANRFLNIDRENKFFGRGINHSYHGAGSFSRPKNWQEAYQTRYNVNPTLSPEKENAVDFIIKTIKQNPHEVTIAEIGPCTNLAMALKKSPEIASLIKRVIYMGGAFYVEGAEFPVAEFNIWVDPESARTAFRANFPEQIIVPLDVCHKIHISKEEFFDLKSRIKSPLFADMMNRHYLIDYFESDNASNYIWDILVSAILIDPNVITEEITLPVDVNDVYSLSYGQTIAFKGYGPEGSKKARIILSVDEFKIHDMLKKTFDNL